MKAREREVQIEEGTHGIPGGCGMWNGAWVDRRPDWFFPQSDIGQRNDMHVSAVLIWKQFAAYMVVTGERPTRLLGTLYDA